MSWTSITRGVTTSTRFAGYDRAEVELGYKRAKIDEVVIDGAFIGGVDAGLDPTGNTGTAPLFDDIAFDLDDRVSVLSGMVKLLLDFGDEERVSFYGGGGF